ncbi:MAG: MFS transporter [Eubacteriaceae bacterium]
MNKKFFMTIAVLSLSFVMMSPGAVTPAIANLAMAFPNISPSVIMMLATIPSLMMVPGNLIAGSLTPKVVSYRGMLIFAFLLMTISGIVPFFWSNFYAILIMRALFGVSLGLIAPLGPGLMFGLFEGPKVATLMGLTSVIMNIGGIVFQMLGGILCVISWKHTFLVHILILVVLAIVFIWLPNPPAAPVTEKGAPKFKMPVAIWGIAFGFGLLMLIMMPVMLNMSIIILGEGLGNAASAGFVLTMNTVGGMVAGLLFGKVFQKTKKYTLPLGLGIAAIGFTTVLFANSLTLLVIGMTMTGFGFSLGMPAVMMIVGNMMPAYATPKAFALMNSFSGVAGFAASFFFAWLMGLINTTWIKFPVAFGVVCLVSFVVVYTIIISRKKTTIETEGEAK